MLHFESRHCGVEDVFPRSATNASRVWKKTRCYAEIWMARREMQCSVVDWSKMRLVGARGLDVAWLLALVADTLIGALGRAVTAEMTDLAA